MSLLSKGISNQPKILNARQDNVRTWQYIKL